MSDTAPPPATADTPPAKPRRRKYRKRKAALRIVTWFGAIVLVLLAAAYLALQTDWARGKITDVALTALEDKLGRPVTFSDLDYEIAGLDAISVRVRDVVIPGPEDDDRPVLTADELRLQISILGIPYLEPSRLTLEQIEIDRPEIYVELRDNGTTNLPEIQSGGGASPVEVRIGRVLVRNGLAEIDERRLPLNFEARDVLARAAGSDSVWDPQQFDFQLRSQRIRLGLQDTDPIPGGLTVIGRYGSGELTLSRLGLQGERLAATGEGRIVWGPNDEGPDAGRSEDDSPDTTIELNLDARMDSALLNELGWLDTSIGGTIRYDGEVGWTPEGLTYDGTVRSPRLAYLDRTFTDLVADVEGTASRVAVDLERAGHAGGTIAATLDLVLADPDPAAGGPRGTVDARLRDLDLATLLEGVEAPLEGLAGRVSGELAYRFPLTDALGGDGDGVLRLAEGRAGAGEMPLSGRVPLSVRNGVLRIEDGRLSAPGQDIAAGGRYDLDGGDGAFDYRIETRDLAALAGVLPLDPSGTLPTAGAGTLEGTAAVEPGTFRTDVAFDLTGVAVASAGTRPIDVGDLDGSLTFEPGRVSNLVARAREGEGSLEVTGDVGLPGRLDLEVALARWPAATVEPFLPSDFPYRGEGDVSGTLRVTGVAEDPAVTGRLTAAPFSLTIAATAAVDGPEPSAGTPGGTLAFDTLEAEIDYRRGVFESLDVLGTQGDSRLAVAGRADLAGPLDLTVNLIDWSSATLEPFLPNDFPYAFAGDVSGELAVAGSIDDPAVAGRIESRGFRLASAETGFEGATRFDTLVTTFDYRSGRFDDLDVDAAVGERRLAVTGSADLAGPLDLEIDLEGWSTETLAALSPTLGGLGVRGDLTGRLRVGGTASQPTVDGRLTTGALEVAGFLLDGVEARFDSADGRINLNDTRVTTPAGVLVADGWIDLAAGTFDIEARGDGLDLSQEPFESRLAADVEGFVDFRANLNGPFESPQGRLTLTGRELELDDRPLGERGAARLALDLTGDQLVLDGSLLGLFNFSGGGRFDRQEVDVTLDVSSTAIPALLDLAMEADPPAFTGRFDGTLHLTGALADLSTLNADLALESVRLMHDGRVIRNLEPVDISLNAEELTIRSVFVGVEDTDSELFLGGSIGMGEGNQGEGGALRLQAQARLGAEWAELVLPGFELDGTLEALATIGGTTTAPRVNGQGQLRSGQVILPDFPHAIDDATALAFFNPGQIILDNFRGSLAGGRVQASGSVDLPRPAAGDREARDLGYNLRAQVQGVSLRYPEGFLIRGDAAMTLASVRGGQELAGVATLERVFYVQDVPTGAAELLRGFLERERLEAGETDELLATTQLAIAVEGPGALRVRNNLADLEGDIDLVVRGTLARPVVFGQIELEPEGELIFQDNEYEVERGLLTFANPVRLDPVIDLVASTEISEYELQLTVSGTLERLRTSFQTDPPLSDLEALQLVATGSVGGPGAGDGSGFATGFLLGQAAGVLSKRVNTLFGFDKLQINPGSSANLDGVGVSVEKRIGSDVFVAYTTRSGSDSQEELLQLGWDITDQITLLFTREGDDALALDIKVEKNF